MDRNLIPSSWNRNCDTSLSEVDNVMKSINLAFDNGESLTTEILFQTKDFQVNINYQNMVMAMCYRDVLTLDLDLPAGYWVQEEADEMIRQLISFTDLMHFQEHIDLLFKIYRTDKGIHAILVNKHLSPNSDEALTIMLSLCNDPFYTAFSRVSGFCLRISPKLYRDAIYNKNINVTSRARSEIISKEYSKPKFIGYGKPDDKILKMLEIKNRLVNFVKEKYRNDTARMTQYRYVSYIDDFRHVPPEDFFEELITIASTMYEKIQPYEEDEIYHYNINHQNTINNHVPIYSQSNIDLMFDPYYATIVLIVRDINYYRIDQKGFEFIQNIENLNYVYYIDKDGSYKILSRNEIEELSEFKKTSF